MIGLLDVYFFPEWPIWPGIIHWFSLRMISACVVWYAWYAKPATLTLPTLVCTTYHLTSRSVFLSDILRLHFLCRHNTVFQHASSKHNAYLFCRHHYSLMLMQSLLFHTCNLYIKSDLLSWNFMYQCVSFSLVHHHNTTPNVPLSTCDFACVRISIYTIIDMCTNVSIRTGILVYICSPQIEFKSTDMENRFEMKIFFLTYLIKHIP